MADEISQALCGAYKDTLKTGVALARTGQELRKAKHEAYKRDPSQEDNSKRKQDIEAQKAFLEMNGVNYEEVVEKVEKAKEEPVVEKKLDNNLIDLYAKKV